MLLCIPSNKTNAELPEATDGRLMGRILVRSIGNEMCVYAANPSSFILKKIIYLYIKNKNKIMIKL